jgi:hypothetical protein
MKHDWIEDKPNASMHLGHDPAYRYVVKHEPKLGVWYSYCPPDIMAYLPARSHSHSTASEAIDFCEKEIAERGSREISRLKIYEVT